MIVSIDHLVFAASSEQDRELRDRLADAGFYPEAFRLEFPESGVASESLSFSGGGFVEFVVELDTSLSPRVWFHETPRLIGLGFSSDDFDADTGWSSEPDGWVMSEDHILPDGSRINIHAAGPHHHLSDFYVFVMDRPQGQLEFPRRLSGPKLRRISFGGSEADQWRHRLGGWLGLSEDSEGLRVGDVELRFHQSSDPTLRVSPTFDVSTGASEIPLARGEIELVRPR
jgi:hypothetical protein